MYTKRILAIIRLFLLCVVLGGCAETTTEGWIEKCANRAYQRALNASDGKERQLLGKYVHLLSAVARSRDLDQLDMDGNSLLILAVRCDDAVAVRQMTTPIWFADLSYQDSNRKSALMYAVDRGDIEVVKMLVECGSAIDQIDMQGRTALIHAVLSRKTEVVKVLLKYGANTLIKDSEQKIATDYAYKNGDVETLNLLSKFENNGR